MIMNFKPIQIGQETVSRKKTKINKCIVSLNKKLIALILIAVAEKTGRKNKQTNKQKKRKKE